MSRRLPDEAQKVFDKYTVNFVRRLHKDKALEMFETDLGLSHERADFMFSAFVAEGNQVLTANDFNNFWICFGKDANDYVNQFNELEKQGNGTADIGGLFDFLKTLKTLSGRCPTDEELENYIKNAAGDSKSIDINKFASLIKRIKMTRN